MPKNELFLHHWDSKEVDLTVLRCAKCNETRSAGPTEDTVFFLWKNLRMRDCPCPDERRWNVTIGCSKEPYADFSKEEQEILEEILENSSD